MSGRTPNLTFSLARMQVLITAPSSLPFPTQVGQDTQFNLGGDPHTSYLYSVGVPVQFHNDERCELWARHLKYEASELFELVSAIVGQVVTDLVRKAERDC
jgi:hypothetical protein